MRLETEFIKLPLLFDAERLAAEVAAIPEADWRPHPQGHPGNSALPLIAAGGDPGNDATKGPMRPTPHLARLPYVRQVLAAFNSVFGRTRLMRLDGNAEATPHVDTNYYWLERVRLHVPIVTRPEVRFLCGDRAVHMAAGEAWIFDTWKTHNVVNPHPTRRIHLVADTVGSAAFWELVESGEPARFVPYAPDLEPQLTFETVNQPAVMSPWEQEVLLGKLLADLAANAGNPAPLITELAGELTRFRRDWRSLWAVYGDAGGIGGHHEYRALLDRLAARLARFEHGLRLANGCEAVEIVRQMVVRPGVTDSLLSRGALRGGSGEEGRGGEGREGGEAVVFDRPVFIVGSPRSGTSLLFETLAQSPDLWTIGGESHALIERIDGLHPSQRGWESNRLTAQDATPATVERLTRAFLAELRDRDGARPQATAGLRLLEKTPKNALRIPFFAAAFPNAVFVYLYRDPRETISSILDAWRSGRFVTYPELPGWSGPPWSLLLVPGWRELNGKSLAEVAAQQWSAATSQLLDDLEALPPERWCVASYDRLVAEPQAEMVRLCEVLDVVWDRELTAPLPLSRHTLTSPDPEKWRHNAAELKPVLPLVTDVAERARDVFAHAPAVRPARKPAASVVDANALRSVFTAAVPQILAELGSTLLVSTYQSGRLIAVRCDAGSLNTHFRAFPSPMGIAVAPHRLALGTQRHVWEYHDQPEVAKKIAPAGKHDACYLPRRGHVTGDVRVHELAFAADGLWIVNTRFSCLASLDAEHSFVPRWRPPFVSALAAEDRCHLNGLAVIDGRVRFATALGATDTAQGWREHKASAGVLIDVTSGEIAASGLSMPHSPRFYAGRLWVLESGKGEVGVVDLASGRVETVAQVPGFTRGLAFAGPYAFVGLSQVRESNIFGGLPLSERLHEKRCGVWVLDVRTGRTLGFLRFEGLVQEIFDVQLLPGVRFPEIAEPDSDLIAGAFVLPQEALAEVAAGGRD